MEEGTYKYNDPCKYCEHRDVCKFKNEVLNIFKYLYGRDYFDEKTSEIVCKLYKGEKVGPGWNSNSQ